MKKPLWFPGAAPILLDRLSESLLGFGHSTDLPRIPERLMGCAICLAHLFGARQTEPHRGGWVSGYGVGALHKPLDIRFVAGCQALVPSIARMRAPPPSYA